MSDWQVFIHCFEDADLLEGALESLPETIPIYVVDGRYATFSGDRDVTPDAPAVCDSYDNVTYHRPPADRLPWGHEHADADPANRWPQYCEMQYSLSIIDESRWTLKMDTDERLQRFAVDLDGLDPREKVHTTVLLEDHAFEDITGDRAYIPRLFVPEQWTFWTDDVFVPREDVPPDAGAPTVKAFAHAGGNYKRVNLMHRDEIVIENIGHERPDDYLSRRDAQLEKLYPA